jgi:hypothetical protein
MNFYIFKLLTNQFISKKGIVTQNIKCLGILIFYKKHNYLDLIKSRIFNLSR